MGGLQEVGKSLIIVGGIIVLIGLFLLASGRVDIPFLGKLPGDIYIKRKNFQFYFPVVTSIVLSLILSLILYIFSHFSKR